jgi:hypothetical protein
VDEDLSGAFDHEQQAYEEHMANVQTGIVEELGQSQSGKPKVKVSGRWYSVKGTNGMAVGSAIEFEASEFQFKGKTFYGIDKWGPASGRVASPASPPASAPVSDAHPRSLGTSPFISNVVGQAIAAGLIKDPMDILAWYEAALAAVEGAPKQTTEVPF